MQIRSNTMNTLTSLFASICLLALVGSSIPDTNTVKPAADDELIDLINTKSYLLVLFCKYLLHEYTPQLCLQINGATWPARICNIFGSKFCDIHNKSVRGTQNSRIQQQFHCVQDWPCYAVFCDL